MERNWRIWKGIFAKRDTYARSYLHSLSHEKHGQYLWCLRISWKEKNPQEIWSHFECHVTISSTQLAHGQPRKQTHAHTYAHTQHTRVRVRNRLFSSDVIYHI